MTATPPELPLLDILIEDPRWDAAGLEALAHRAAGAVLADLGLDPAAAEISLLGCDDARIADLNESFRDKPRPTNVLSWPAEERRPAPGAMPPAPTPRAPGLPVELGDIAIAYDTTAAEAKAGGLPFENHVMHLLVHGLLHLIGFDHETDEEAALMEAREVAILASMGLPDPYSGPDALRH